MERDVAVNDEAVGSNPTPGAVVADVARVDGRSFRKRDFAGSTPVIGSAPFVYVG